MLGQTLATGQQSRLELVLGDNCCSVFTNRESKPFQQSTQKTPKASLQLPLGVVLVCVLQGCMCACMCPTRLYVCLYMSYKAEAS